MPRKPKQPDQEASTPAPLALPTITRAQANEMLKARAVELYQTEVSRRQEGIARFEQEIGRADRIDSALLDDLRRLQLRFAAIAARQQTQRSQGFGTEPKVDKFVKQLGEIIGAVTVQVATDNAMELFAKPDEAEYIGYRGVSNGSIPEKGYDESVLAGFRIIDNKKGKNVTPADKDTDNDEGVCLHEDVEPDEDDPAHATCECGEEFELTGDGTPAPDEAES